ncbi:CheR family methyltransferase [Nocardia huaxiensis]|uniref:CheR family methyltransferase n=1 Tax=Nocardia huaxiensis TaxID=2755382 RepID=UPI001E32891E|nr:CheR family methyltransferase [Nocardia huaxiensis]UFS95579.1 PAS domain S-box protein [Nocardia huaxiensis]
MEQDRTPSAVHGFEEILQYLKEARGFDFTGYKRSSLMRRVDRRMAQLSLDDYVEYLDVLQANSDEFVALFNTILINVTGFFRDPDAWEFMQQDVVPTILAERGPEEPIRVWCAGCASGEEAYSLAIALAEVLGVDEFRQRVKIYATDVDEEALSTARHAVYSEKEVQPLGQELIQRYFEPIGGRYSFRKDLRRTVIFGRNDLVQDAPISRIDLLACRNTLMYFNAETQTKILDKFHFALAPRGMLFLGKAEMLLSHSRTFDPVDLKRRVFRKVPATRIDVGTVFGRSYVAERRDVEQMETLRGLAFSNGPVAQVVLGANDVVSLANQQAKHLFGLSDKDVGRPLRDLELSYRPVELRGYIDQVRTERRALRIKDVEWQRGPGEVLALEVHVSPLLADEITIGVSVVFHDVTANRRLLSELSRANQQRESAYEELQSTNEELETTNEELQSTVEELETTNEELQSTNEELETTNEELQSTNDELQTINTELRERSNELDEVNEFFAAVMSSWPAGVAVVDTSMRIVVWNSGAENLWGMRSDEAEGEHLLNLDIGLPVAELRPIVRPALNDSNYRQEIKLEGVNRRGRAVTVRVVCTSLRDRTGMPTGAILVMEPFGNGNGSVEGNGLGEAE